jgi:hypothetical protein
MALTTEDYKKFFGTTFLDAILELEPELIEAVNPVQKDEEPEEPEESEEDDPMDSTVGRFLHHLSSPMIHPSYMPGQSHKIYGEASVNEELEPYKGFFDLTEEPAAVAKPAMKPKKVALKQPVSADPAARAKERRAAWLQQRKSGAVDPKKQHGVQEIERIKNEARARMNARGQQAGILHAQGKHYEAQAMSNPFEYMRRGFHAAFGVDPKTGQKVAQEDEPTRQKKYQDARKMFVNHLVQHGKLSPATAKGSNMFGVNHKTLSSAGVGYKTIGLSLSPGLHSGYQHPTTGKEYDMCPNASSECRKGCLGLTAGGNVNFPFSTTRAKLLRTHFMHEHPEEAARIMHQEILDNEKGASEAQVQRPMMGPDGKPAMQPTGKVDRKSGKPIMAPKTEPVFDKAGQPVHYKSGIRMNVTSDLPYEHLMPKEFFHSHLGNDPENPNTTFYDYTKMHGRLGHKDQPQNYHLALSHTGSGHDESNDKEVVKHLENGGVVASVYRRGKHEPQAKFYQDDATGKMYPVAAGDADDNIFQRHEQIGVPRTQGVISGLALKGIGNETAGHFANTVDQNGIVHLNAKPKPNLVQIGGLK